MVDMPLDKLLEVGYQNLRAEPAGVSRDRREDRSQTHAAADSARPRKGSSAGRTGLLQTFRDVLGGLRQFIVDHKIVTIPSTVPPIVEETPPFMRALTTASMDTPGPYEKVAKEAFFNVTLPEPDWTPRAGGGAPGELQPRHHRQHRHPRSLSGALYAVSMGAERALESAQADRHRHQRRRLGALHRADDARSKATARAISNCAWASCRTRCCATRATSWASRCTPAR